MGSLLSKKPADAAVPETETNTAIQSQDDDTHTEEVTSTRNGQRKRNLRKRQTQKRRRTDNLLSNMQDEKDSPSGKRHKTDHSEKEKEDNIVKCPICYMSCREIYYRSPNYMVTTMCGHIFCNICLNFHMKKVKICPTCRQKVTSKKIIRLYI